MKTRKLLVRLFPDPGRVIKGAFVYINNTITIAEHVTPSSVTVKLGSEEIEFPTNAVKLAKYFAFSINGKRLIGEISFKDYDLVKDKLIIVGEIFPKPSPVERGDKVRINKPSIKDFEKCHKCDFEGVVVKATSRLFDIALANEVVTVRRSQFKLINKPDYRNVIKVIIHKIQNPNN